MDIKRVAKSAVNEVIVMTVTHMDYKGQVQKRINEKMPLATVKGFRKGAVPKDLVAKQYGKAIKVEEVMKVVDLALSRYIQSEGLRLLGTAIPVVNENFSWDVEEMVFEFEIGLVPQFDLDLEASNNIIKYKVVADEKMIDEQVTSIRKRFGKQIPQDTIDADSDVSGIFTNEEKGINAAAKISLDIFKNKDTADKFIGKKVGDVVTVNTKGLFEDDHKLMDVLKVSHDDVHGLNVAVDFKIDAISGSELAEMDQELFDKMFGPGNVATAEELKEKIKIDSEAYFAQQTEQKLMADVSDFLIENTKFDLPDDFLKRWLQVTGEKKLTAAEAEAEYARSEKGLRFQLIESKALSQSNIKINFEDLKAFTAKSIKQQMAQYGQTNPSDAEVETIVARVLSNQEEVKKLSDQVVAEKMLEIFKEKANPETKEVSYEGFIAASYGE